MAETSESFNDAGAGVAGDTGSAPETSRREDIAAAFEQHEEGRAGRLVWTT